MNEQMIVKKSRIVFITDRRRFSIYRFQYSFLSFGGFAPEHNNK